MRSAEFDERRVLSGMKSACVTHDLWEDCDVSEHNFE